MALEVFPFQGVDFLSPCWIQNNLVPLLWKLFKKTSLDYRLRIGFWLDGCIIVDDFENMLAHLVVWQLCWLVYSHWLGYNSEKTYITNYTFKAHSYSPYVDSSVLLMEGPLPRFDWMRGYASLLLQWGFIVFLYSWLLFSLSDDHASPLSLYHIFAQYKPLTYPRTPFHPLLVD